jgi:hypothetical protein
MSEPTAISVARIGISYDADKVSGRLTCDEGSASSAIWSRIKSRTVAGNTAIASGDTSIELPWPEVLNILREFGSRQTQQLLSFRFLPTGDASERIRQFAEEVRAARSARDTLTVRLTAGEIEAELKARGFTRRGLKEFQLRDLAHVASLARGKFLGSGFGQDNRDSRASLANEKAGLSSARYRTESGLSSMERNCR